MGIIIGQIPDCAEYQIAKEKRLSFAVDVTHMVHVLFIHASNLIEIVLEDCIQYNDYISALRS